MREMKDSGVEWIGEIPVTWELSKIGSIYDERNEKVSDQDYEPLSVTKQGIVPQLETAAKTDNGDNRKLIKKNDFVINSRSDRRGSCGISEYDGSCSLINTVLRPQRNMCNKYYGFVFKSDNFADEYYRWGHGIVNDLWSTKWSDMKNIYIPMPNFEEQKRIADYLDLKCSQIDAIIEKQQASICKLIEYKKAIIYEMIKENEDNYKVRLKNIIVNVQSGLSAVSSEDNGVESGNYVLRTSAVSSGEYKKDEIKPVMTNCINRLICPLEDDILVVSRMNTAKMVGFAAYIEQADTNYYLPDKLWKVIADRNKACTKYLWYAINSPVIHDQYASIATGTSDSMINISISDFTGAKFSLPPLEKQKEIVKILDEKVSYIEQQVELKSQMIDKLISYKKSLIYEVVTGKKEV